MRSLELKIRKSIRKRRINNVVIDEEEYLKLAEASFKLERAL